MKNKLLTLLFLSFFVLNYSQKELSVLNIDNDSSFTDLSILDSVDSSNRLFFSGENHAFHKSNLKLELKLLKYFNKKHGVNTLLLEFGMGTGWLTNEYVHTGREDLRLAIKTQFSKSFLNYFEKIKEYNDSLEEKDKVKIVGIDLQRSFSLGFEVLNFLLPNDSIFPSDSIMKEVELIKFLQGYNKARLSNKDFGSRYYKGKKYSNYESMKVLLDNFDKFKSDYKAYLGDNFDSFDEVMECSKKTYYYKSRESEGTPMGILFREDYMYNKLNELAKQNKNDKYYGQFGRSHTLKKVSSDKYAHNFSSLVAKINKYKEGELNDKVVSIGIYYIENADENVSVFYQDNDVENVILEELVDFPSDSLGILKVEENSLIDSVLNNNYKYIIVHNGSYEEENSDLDEMFVYTEPINSINFYYGYYNFDVNGLNNYFGTNYSSLNTYFGFSFSGLNNSFYYDYHLDFILKQKEELDATKKTELNGLNFMFDFGYDVLKSKKIDLIPMVGIGYQNLALRLDHDTATTNFAGLNSVDYQINNSAFILDFAGEIRVRLVKDFLALSLKSGYRLDLSDPRWVFEKNKLDVKTNMNGLYAQFSICLGNF